nr:hypothetical protein DM860_000705 [Ipomoea trifida]GMC58378.1 protein DOWN-REGULATED IN DIF1 11-like [Ipomoea batatas]GMC61150.1 protein DOWN-REGULATED IN DIF1 11-like [Ipomoea batatas]GMC63355.1 protein DOWN-REGULATED IN DIF1 11-like [Ipomoea batatas]GMC64937.1 protein DOWN-REGULATED IN DIF1 11-like [Ipomoea batatas]
MAGRLSNGVSIITLAAAFVMTLMLLPGGTESRSQQQWYIDYLPKNVTEFLDNCTEHMALDCATEVITAMVTKGQPPSEICCGDLMLMGIECHTSLMKVYVNSPEGKPNAAVITSNSRRVFDECVAVDKKRRYGNLNITQVLP